LIAAAWRFTAPWPPSWSSILNFWKWRVANLRRWLSSSPTPVLREWQRLLDALFLDQLLTLLRSTDEEAARLRQSGPFAGLLSTAERQAILAKYESSFA